MGGSTFETIGEGKDSKEAFQLARESAQYERGHGGYTGTIAEKHSFVVISTPTPITDDKMAYAYANDLMDKDDKRIRDKWGDAGAIKLPSKPGSTKERWLFFGWASS